MIKDNRTGYKLCVHHLLMIDGPKAFKAQAY